MNILLDTHALIWWLNDDPALSGPARAAIADASNSIFVSAASAMEVATKYRIGKLPSAALLAQNFETIVEAEHFLPLPISLRHAALAGSLKVAHQDPFDRLFIAQAMTDDMALASNEKLFDGYGITRVW